MFTRARTSPAAATRRDPFAKALAVALALTVGATGARAHGGEDHGAPAAPVGGVAGGAGLATAEAHGTYELLLRWGPVGADAPLALEAFVADVTTNAPVAGSLKLALAGPTPLTLEGAPLAPGHYRFARVRAQPGRYTVTATVRGEAGIDLLTTEVVLATAPSDGPVAPATHSNDGAPLLWAALALVLALTLAALGYVAGRRAGRDTKPPAPRRSRPPTLAAAAALALASGAAWLALASGEAGAHGGEDHGTPAAAVTATSGGAVRLPKDVQFLLEVRTAASVRRTLTERRRVAGTVTLPPGARASVVAPFTGRLEAPADGASPQLGEPVRRGQVLAMFVELPIAADRAGLAAERAKATGERDAAASTLRALRLELQRKRTLEGIVAAQELTDLEAAIGRAEAELKGARAAVDALTLGAGTTTLALVAPIDGVVGAIGPAGAAPGNLVEGGATLFEIVDLTRPWVAAKVFESDLARLDRDGDALVLGDGLPAEGVRARPVAVSPIVDPATRTVDVVYSIDGAPDGVMPAGGVADRGAPSPLRVNQFVRVDLPLGATRDALAVPAAAVVEIDGAPSVWVKRAAEVFALRAVALGRRDGGFVEVRGGLAPDALVVSEGASFLRGATPVSE